MLYVEIYSKMLDIKASNLLICLLNIYLYTHHFDCLHKASFKLVKQLEFKRLDAK